MQDEIIAVYEKEEAINKILEWLETYTFNDLIKTDHFLYSVDEKGTDLELLGVKFNEFDKIKLVVKRKHKNSEKISYDLYYKIDEQTYYMYAISFAKEKPMLINAYQVDRNFGRFRNWIISSYKDKLVS